MNIKKKAFCLFCVLTFSINASVVSAEDISTTYTGINNAQEILNNIDFKDIKAYGKDYWAKDAILKMASLNIIQGYGEKSFGPKNNVSKAEAIALIYRALGKEADAQKEVQTLQNQNTEDTNLGNIWAQGYLSLAQKDGLITREQFDQAVSGDSSATDQNVFLPNSPAKRQEVAVWAAKAFDIEPNYNPVSIYNNYNDWKNIESDNIPYVESILNKKIMNGDNGHFYPQDSLKREEMAQILLNLEDYIYEANNLNKAYGFIEDIDEKTEYKFDKDVTIKKINLRMNDGKLASISTSKQDDRIDNTKKEVGNHEKEALESEIIVNKDGILGKSELLKDNEEVTIIYDDANRIKYIEDKMNQKGSETNYGTVINVDETNNSISFLDTKGTQKDFLVSNGAIINIDNEAKGLSDIPYGAKAYFKIEHNMVLRIDIKDLRPAGEDTNSNVADIRGIVQDTNPNLYYISLYGKNGKRNSELVKTYKFTPNTQIRKNGQAVTAEDIEIGDTVYIKFGTDNKAALINVESNYISRTGEVLNTGKNFVTVKYDDNTIHQLNYDNDVLILKDGDIAEKSDISSGDKVKVTVNQNDDGEVIKAVSIQGSQDYITSIYKGTVTDIDDENLILSNVRKLVKDRWVLDAQRGLQKINLDEKAKLYYNNKLLNTDDAKKIYENKNVYFAVYKDYSDNEKAIMVTSNEGLERTYNSEVNSQLPSSKTISATNTFDSIKYGEGTIVVRHGRLTSGNNIKQNDPFYGVSLRNATNGLYLAQIINITEKPSIQGVDIYRGRILSIDEENSFTLESFSILRGTRWEFIQSQKTFDLSPGTRIFNNQGLVDNRDFIDYTDTNFKSKTVYIAAVGTKAELISETVYGVINLRGEIYNTSLDGEDSNDENNTLKLKDSYVLNMNTGNWDSLGESTVDVLANSIIIKNGKIANMDDLEIYDKIRVIKKENSATGDALIVLVEG